MISRVVSCFAVGVFSASSLVLVACDEDDPAPTGPVASGGSAGSAGSAGLSGGAGGPAQGGSAGSLAQGGAGGAGGDPGAAGGAGAGQGSLSPTCQRIASVKGELDVSSFVTLDPGLPFCIVGVHAIEGDITNDYGNVGQLGASGKLIGNLKGKTGYVVWTAPAATPENATASLGKGTEIAVTADGVPAGVFFQAPSGDQSSVYLGYAGSTAPFAGELLQIGVGDGKITGRATANGLYAVTPGTAANDFFFTGLSNLGAASTVAANNGVYRGSCSGGACTGTVVKQWGDSSGPMDVDEKGTVFVAHSTFGMAQTITAFSTFAGGNGMPVDGLTDLNFTGSLAAVQGQLVVAESNAATFAQEPLLFVPYALAGDGAVTMSAPSTSRVRPVGATTLNVVGSEAAAGELWIIADSNGFAPAGQTVFIRLERTK